MRFTPRLTALGHRRYNRSNQKESLVFPFLNPRLPDLLLGMIIGLAIALGFHWLAWAF